MSVCAGDFYEGWLWVEWRDEDNGFWVEKLLPLLLLQLLPLLLLS